MCYCNMKGRSMRDMIRNIEDTCLISFFCSDVVEEVDVFLNEC